MFIKLKTTLCATELSWTLRNSEKFLRIKTEYIVREKIKTAGNTK